VDARDQWLSKAAKAHPYLVKCNQHEAQRVLRHPISTAEQARDAARVWIDLGVKHVVITLGGQGAVAVQADEAWHVAAPSVESLCPVGSGDALMAGLLFSLAQGESLSSATQYGVALGAANTLQLGSARLDWQALPRLLKETRAIPLT
jgi:fructose-1-phosphate kinase PfkB-like protein